MSKKGSNEKKYTGGGVILLLSQGKENYIVLAKRSEDAKVNPNGHSGFFGGTELEDNKDPLVTASRELNEEILITTKDKKKAFYFNLDDKDNEAKIAKESIKLWGEKFKEGWIDAAVSEKPILLKAPSDKYVDYIEHDGWKKVYTPAISLKDSLDELVFFDCETKDEHPRKELLDRQIDIFKFEEFRDWWLSNSSLCLKAHFSFRSGRMIACGFIVRENKRISPSLILALNQWYNEDKMKV